MTLLPTESLFHAAPRRYEVLVDNVRMAIGSDVSVTEDMTQLTTVAEFSLAERGTSLPSAGQTVSIWWVDFHNSRRTPVFGGTVDSIDVESTPWSYRCRCVDQLANLRRTKTGSDMVLTGLTDGEAWKAIADYCGIDYLDADIADQGYVLGARAPVYWLADGQTPASSMIQELDNIFRCSTLTIGNNRVIRHRYDPYPSTATLAKTTYIKGSSLRWQSHHRNIGGGDGIQNIWMVTGAAVESEDGSCTTTPWAKGVSGNAELGGRSVRVVQQSVSSDLIQDQSLAEFIATWKMGETNRRQETATATIFNDPNIHAGSVVGLQDVTPGIDADTRYALITNIQRSGPSMSLTLTAGPHGSFGTITSGMDVQCNDSNSPGSPADDGFTPGDPGSLPDTSFDPIDPTDYPDGGDPTDDTAAPPPAVDEPIICTDPEAHTFIWGAPTTTSAYTYWRDRHTLKDDWTYARMDGHTPMLNDALVAVPVEGTGTLILTTNVDTATATNLDDRVFPANSEIAVCAHLAVCGNDTTIEFALLRADNGASFGQSVIWKSAPTGDRVTGISPGTAVFMGEINIANGSIVTDLSRTPGPISNGGIHRNTGRFFPFPAPGSSFPVDTHGAHPEDFTFYDVCAAWDLSGQYQSAYAFGDLGEGVNVSEECLTPTCTGGVIHYTANTHDFVLAFQVNRPSWSTGDCWPVIIQNFTLGITDCENNALYEAPWNRTETSDGDG